MEPTLRRAIARIDIIQQGSGVSRGTGFLVARDLVLTAMHVVADRSAPGVTPHPGRIALTFPTHATDATVVDGRADPRTDWILLRCETPPTDVRAIPLADRVEDGASWETYGFPDANPRDGMVQSGRVKNASGDFGGVAAYQLFSEEAAAGTGAPVKGLSGGPVIVDGAVVALLRSSLMKDGQNVAGTLYGCPIDRILDRCGDLLPIADPVRGLPGFARRPLPATPFRFLERFTAADAEIFFGRNREIRQLYDQATLPEGPGLILLYGQSGAGKSSFLDAGLLPRLESSHATNYVRRDRSKGLLATLLDAVASPVPSGTGGAPSRSLLPAEALRLAWLRTETAAGRPLVTVLDQVEEVFTLPSDDPDELTTFIDALSHLLQPGTAPQGRLILGFRKEWFAEIKKVLDTRMIEFDRPLFLEALDRESVMEIVTGLQRTKRLHDRYGLEVESGLGEAIARDLTADRNSPVAPMLQVLLSRMWHDATAASNSAPRFTLALYERLRDEGFQLTDFLDQQLATLEQVAATSDGSMRDVVESGLALDVLRFHSSELGTARNRTAEELRAQYERDADVEWFVRESKARYLLSEPTGDAPTLSTTTRLAHDTLAPAVKARFDESDRRGQRARRILENRASEWTDAREGTPLDARDLSLVEQGLSGMRALRAEEGRLLRASQIARDEDERVRQRWRRIAQVAAVVLVLSLAGALTAVYLMNMAQRRAALAARQTAQALSAADLREARNATLSGDTTRALAHLARALRLDPDNASARASAFDYLGSVPRLEFELGHEGPVLAAAFSPDGTRLITASGNALRVWNAQTGEAVGQPLSTGSAIQVWDAQTGTRVLEPRREDFVIAVTIRPDGTWVTRHADGTVRAWEASTGEAVAVSAQRRQFRGVMAFSPDWARVVTRSPEDGTQQLWDTRTGEKVGRALPDTGLVLAAEGLRLGGTRVVMTASDDAAKVVDARTGEVVGPLQHEEQVTGAAFSPDGIRVVTVSDDGTARLWNAQTGQAVGLPLPGGLGTAAFSPDGTRVVTASDDGMARVWNARTGEAVGPPLRHRRGVLTAAFSPDGTRVVTGSVDMMARVWDVRAGQAGVPLRHRAQVTSAAFTADGTQVVTAPLDTSARVWDSRTGEALGAPLEFQGVVHTAGVSADGRRVVSASPDGTARVWDARTGQAMPRVLPHVVLGSLAPVLSPDGALVVTVTDSLTAEVWNALTGQAVGKPLRHESGNIVMTVFSPDGTRVVTVSSDTTARVWEARTGREVVPPLKHQGAVISAAFNRDGTRIATVSLDSYTRTQPNTVRVWDAGSGEAVGSPLQPGSFVTAVALSPDGTGVLIESGGTARVWDARTGQATGAPLLLEGSVNTAAFSSDGARVVTASDDGTRVWDARTGEPIGQPLPGVGGEFVAFSPDGTRVVTTSDNAATVWDAQVGTRDDSLALADLAEALGGFRISDGGPLEPLTNRKGRFEALRKQASGAEPGTPGAAAFIRWVLADPWARSISPLSSMTVDEYINRMLSLGDAGRAEAERVFLGHPRLSHASQ